MLAFFLKVCYCSFLLEIKVYEANNLQGRVRFPTGGTVRVPKRLIRCDSGTNG